MNKVKLILVKLSGCPHCRDYLPIFDLISIKMKEEPIFKGTELEIKTYDREEDKIKFESDNKHLVFWASRVPTLFLDCAINGIDQIYNLIKIEIPTNEEDKEKIVNNTIHAIIYYYNNFVFKYGPKTGGNNDIYYKNKYLKYKNKYLNSKNNN
jgi:hypothetical protein